MKNHFTVGNNSVGEIYHLAMHAIAMEQEGTPIEVKFLKPHNHTALDFFSDLEISYIAPGRDSKNSLSKRDLTPAGIEKAVKKYSNVLKEKSKAILKLSNDEGWKFPFPQLLTPDLKVLLWQRNSTYKPERNSSIVLLKQLAELAGSKGCIPIIIGVQRGIQGAIEIGNFWEHDFFRSGHNLAKQLWFQHILFADCGTKASVGMMSGAMDGAAMFFGHKTIFFAKDADAKPRMSKVSSVVPGLMWFPAEFDKFLSRLNDQQIQHLVAMIFPLS
jgi:hypothetical protein